MTALTPAAYLADQIADEMDIARLLGYRKIERPAPLLGCPNVIWGTHPDFKPEWEGALGRRFLPQWRRSWDGAGELIARCDLTVSAGATSGKAGFGYGTPSVASTSALYEEHPTKESAIRAAICKAAIAYLTAESTTAKAKP